MYDLIIKNGMVIDPSQNLHQKKDLYIKDGVLTEGPSDSSITPESERQIDASGCFVAPGLVDAHLHLFKSGSEMGGRADLVCPPNCVTTAIDAGSSGLYNFESFYQNDILHSTTTIKATLHPSNTGVQMPPHEEIQDPACCDYSKIRALFQKYPDTLVGLKIRVHSTVTAPYGLAALAKAVQVSTKLQEDGFQCNVMVHFGNLEPGITVQDVVSLLQPGDVLTHIFRTNGTTIFDEGGKVLPCIRAARDRGVLFESGCARSHLSLVNAKKSFDDGFYPQIISTDMIGKTFYWKPSYSLLYKMSLYLNLGMNMNALVDAASCRPASTYRISGAGTLKAGASADVAIFKEIEKAYTVEDLYGGKLDCSRMLVPMATVKGGQIVFQQIYM